MTQEKHWSDFELTKDTKQLDLIGKLSGIYYKYFIENWTCYNGNKLCEGG